MIGVLCEDDERAVVREFFELFKTPWGFHDDRSAYDVVLVSNAGAIAGLKARLVVVFATTARDDDFDHGLRSGDPIADIGLDGDRLRLPIYRGASAISARGGRDSPPTLLADGRAFAFTRIGQRSIVRCGYNLFSEVAFLLSHGQPVEHAAVPTVELHIDLLRRWILDAGLPLVEIPPHPPNCDLLACLTHDVDFLGIREHKLDRTFLGFVYRASVGSIIDFLRRRRSLRQVLRNWLALLSLPLVFTRLKSDFWIAFDRYLEMEGALRSTFYFVPFRGRPGRGLGGAPVPGRKVSYGVRDAKAWVQMLVSRGFEVGVHGIDAWNSVELGRKELAAVAAEVGSEHLGVRMHWLHLDDDSFAKLDDAGFVYDSTFGYNETIGFRAGTAQVFRPLSATRLLELPLHIQDTALLFPRRMNRSEKEAVSLSTKVIDHVHALGGVVTISWHERSLVPERQWDRTYDQLLSALRARHASVRPAGEIVDWFATRRRADLEGVTSDASLMHRLASQAKASPEEADLLVRFHGVDHGSSSAMSGATCADVPIRSRDAAIVFGVLGSAGSPIG